MGRMGQMGDLRDRLLGLVVRHEGERVRAGQRGAGVAGWYDELAALVLLREELFGHILPRIVRRLSFGARRVARVAVPPVDAGVDWERSLLHHWQHVPDATVPPLELYARERRREFATPANVLVVVTLLEVRGVVRRLAYMRAGVLPDLHQFCGAVVVQCEQALAFPQFAAIVPVAQPYVGTGDAGALAAQVAAQVTGGDAGAYADLLVWRQQWGGLRLLATAAGTRAAADRLVLDEVYAL